MSRSVSERVKVMKREFMALHREGFSIQEVADRFQLHRSTAYLRLGEIAEENGISRESLLERVTMNSKQVEMFNQKRENQRVSFEEIEDYLVSAKDSFEGVIAKIDEILKEEEIQ